MKIKDSIIFDIDAEVILINNLEVINCTFENVLLINSKNSTII